MGYVGPPVLQKKTPCRSVTSSKALLGLCCLVLGQSCHVMRLPFGSLKFSHETVSTVQAFLYYTVTRYIPFEVYFKVRQNHTAADIFLNYLRFFTKIKSSPISDIRPIGEGLIKRKVFAGAHTI